MPDAVGGGASGNSPPLDTTFIEVFNYEGASLHYRWKWQKQGNDSFVYDEHRAYYTADERLVASNVQHCLVQQNAWGGTCASWGTNDLDPEVFEEYRYDALGRRIWSRARGPAQAGWVRGADPLRLAVGDHPLTEADILAERGLREAARLAQAGEAFAESVEGAFLHRREGRGPLPSATVRGSLSTTAPPARFETALTTDYHEASGVLGIRCSESAPDRVDGC